MKKRLAIVMLFMLLLSLAASVRADSPQQELTWDQVMQRERPDTTLRRGPTGDTLEAYWTRAHKVELPAVAGGWTTLWIGPQQSVSYRPIGAAAATGRAAGSAVAYAGAWDGADIQVRVEPGRYKEDIILQKPPGRNTWTYEVKLNHLEATQVDQGTVQFGLLGTPYLEVRDLVALDAAGRQAPVHVALRQAGQATFLDVSVDAAWLGAATYPVTVDPTTVGSASGWQSYMASLVAQNPNGNLMVALGPRVYTSTNKGSTWTNLATISDAYQDTCVASDNNNNFYALYKGAPYYPNLRWRLRKYAWNGSTWTNSSYYDVTTQDVFQEYGCSMSWDAKYNNIVMMYSKAYYTGSFSVEWDWGYFKVASSTLGGGYQIDYAYCGSCNTPAYGNILTLGTNGTAYIAWGALNATGLGLRSYTSSDGTNYYQGSTYSLNSSTWGHTMTVDANNNLVIGQTGSTLQVINFNTSSGSYTTTTLETSNLYGNNRPTITNLNNDLYLYFTGGDNYLYYRQYKNSLGAWQSRALLQSGNLSSPNSQAKYFTNDGAWVVWSDGTTSTAVFGGVVPPQAPNAPSNLSPSGNTWINTLTPQLTWTYSNPNPSDGQGAYQVQIKNSGGTVILDTGKVSSANQYYNVPASVLAHNNSYTWAVTTWDTQGNLQGAWSTWAAFRTDTSNPAVTTNINSGAQYTSSTGVTINVSATDTGSGPSQMNFTYKGNTTAWQAYATSAPFTLTTPDGLQTVTVNVKDGAGNVGSADAPITLDTTLPTVSITSPANSAQVGGTVTIQTNATDNIAMQKVMFYHGSTLIGTTSNSPWQIDWDTTAVANGTYALTATAYDQANNQRTATAINVTVDNHPPTVSLTAPASGSTIRGVYTLQATASDSVGIQKVDFYVDGTTLIGTDTTSPYSMDWNSGTASNGSHTLTARATNNYGNTNTSAPVSITLDNSPVTGTLAVAVGATAGPGGTLNLYSTSAWAVTWTGLDYKLTTDPGWTHVTGSGSYVSGAATIPWSVPTTPGTYQIRVDLVDAQNNGGYTDTLQLVLPGAPSTSVTPGHQGDLFLTLPAPADGNTSYTITRATTSDFTTGSDLLAAGYTGTSFRDGINHVPNASFEWGTMADGTAKSWTTLGSASYAVESGSASAGTYSVHIVKATATGQDGLLQSLFTGAGLNGHQFTLSGWLRSSNVSTGAGAGAWLELRFLQRDGTQISTLSTAVLTGTNAWQRYSVSGTVPANSYSVQVAVVFNLASGEVWADGIQVEPGGQLSTFTPGALLDVTTYYYRVVTWNGPLYSTPSTVVSAAYRDLPDIYGRWNKGVR